MGVPITFLDKANPNQFEIIMLANGNTRSNVNNEILNKVGYQNHVNDKGGLGIVNGKENMQESLFNKIKNSFVKKNITW